MTGPLYSRHQEPRDIPGLLPRTGRPSLCCRGPQDTLAFSSSAPWAGSRYGARGRGGGERRGSRDGGEWWRKSRGDALQGDARRGTGEATFIGGHRGRTGGQHQFFLLRLAEPCAREKYICVCIYSSQTQQCVTPQRRELRNTFFQLFSLQWTPSFPSIESSC